MGSDNFFNKHREERRKRKENIAKQRSSNWLVVCEGLQTEPNYLSLMKQSADGIIVI